MQRNSSIENIIKALEKQITKGNTKSRIPTSNRPNTTYRERASATSYVKGGVSMASNNQQNNSKLSKTNKIMKTSHNVSSHMRSSTSKGGPL